MGKFKKIFAPLVAIAIAMLAFVEPAMAQTAVDATVATGQITEGETAATTVGQAIIGFAALVMVFRWVKAQFF